MKILGQLASHIRRQIGACKQSSTSGQSMAVALAVVISGLLSVSFINRLNASTMVAVQSDSPIESKGPSPEKTTTLVKHREGLDCRYLPILEQSFLSMHVKYNSREKEIETRTINQFVKTMDPSKIVFTEDDFNRVQKMMTGLFDRTKSADCGFLQSAHSLYLARLKDRVDFVKKFLGKDYKLDEKAEFVFDLDKKPWPKSNSESEDFLRKYVHFQVANYISTDTKKLNEAKAKVIKNYERLVKRAEEKTDDDLFAQYLDSFARSLDPHSSYLSRDVLEDFQIQMRLSLDGIGATLSSQDGFTVIEYLVPGGAAARSGLLEVQDKILAVGQATGEMDNVVDMDLKDVVRKIRGPKGTVVRLLVLRKEKGSKKKMTVSITRDKISLEEEAASIIYKDVKKGAANYKIGILNFPSFYADEKSGRSSADDLKKLIKDAVKKKVDGLVLDLSSNGGGSLPDAVKVAGLFFATGNVVKQSSHDADDSETLPDRDPTVDWGGPLVVLTSRLSASASEIVSGALQDYKRAVIVGSDHTFGKGSVQAVHPMPANLGALKVTVGMFYVPGGNSTQHRGVSADIQIPSAFESDDIGEKALEYSLPPKKIPPFLSPEASGGWTAVKADWIKTLAERSKARVDKSEDFKKIIADLKKTEEKGKLIKVADILNDKGEKEKIKKAKAKKLDKALREKEYLKRADINEAESVLTDLIDVQAGKALQ